MAGEASASEISDPLFGGRRIVRVVAGDAGETVSALSLALALQQRFPLAGRSAVGAQLSGVNEVSYVVGKIFSRDESSQGTSRWVHRSFAFEMTLQAYRISLAGRQFCRIQNRGCPAARQVCCRISMTRLAGDAAVQKGLRPEVIVGAAHRLHAGSVTVETAPVHLQGERHFARIDRFWVHIPHALLAIPVHRALKPIAVVLKQIGAAALARADEIGEFLLPFESLL